MDRYKTYNMTNRDKGTGMKLAFFTRKHPNARCLLDYFLMEMDSSNHLIISAEAISEALTMGPKTVQRALRALRKHKLIMSIRTGRSNIYFVNPNIAQYKNAHGYRMYEFNAKVILCSKEMNVWLDTFTEKDREIQQDRMLDNDGKNESRT